MVELPGASGRVVGGRHVNGDDNWFDQALDIAVGPSGNTVAAGNLVNLATGSDFAVVQIPGPLP